MDILLDLFFVTMQAHGVDVVSCCPEFATPEELLDFRVFQENLFCGDTLGDLGDLGGQHYRDRLDQKVNMVFVGSNLNKVQVIRWCKFNANFLECLFYWLCEDFPAILCRTNQMVRHTANIASFPYVFLPYPQYTIRRGPGNTSEQSSEEIYLIIAFYNLSTSRINKSSGASTVPHFATVKATCCWSGEIRACLT